MHMYSVTLGHDISLWEFAGGPGRPMSNPIRRGLRALLTTRLREYCRTQRPEARILAAGTWLEAEGQRSRLRQLGWSVYAASALESRAGRCLVALRSRSAGIDGQVYEVMELDGTAAILAVWSVDAEGHWTLVEPRIDVTEHGIVDGRLRLASGD
jgi:hypothetical protein